MSPSHRFGRTSHDLLGLNSAAHEFTFTDRDFERIRRLIYEHAGISLCDMKKEMVYNRLARQLRTLGLTSFREYLERLEGGAPQEWEAFSNALTTNLTAFFREPHHFQVLADHVRTVPAGREIRIWCCAAATGEEPYSIAMTLVETFGSLHPPARILATDLDTNVLAKGEAGVYSAERIENIAKERLRQFFLKGEGPNAGLVRVRDELRTLVTFRRINLQEESWPIQDPFDLIFCRNVMIYFDKATQYRILRRFVPLLRPDGLLIAGHSESFFHAADLFTPCGRTVYRRARK